jgi:hypothetical protein
MPPPSSGIESKPSEKNRQESNSKQTLFFYSQDGGGMLFRNYRALRPRRQNLLDERRIVNDGSRKKMVVTYF